MLPDTLTLDGAKLWNAEYIVVFKSITFWDIIGFCDNKLKTSYLCGKTFLASKITLCFFFFYSTFNIQHQNFQITYFFPNILDHFYWFFQLTDDIWASETKQRNKQYVLEANKVYIVHQILAKK